MLSKTKDEIKPINSIKRQYNLDLQKKYGKKKAVKDNGTEKAKTSRYSYSRKKIEVTFLLPKSINPDLLTNAELMVTNWLLMRLKSKLKNKGKNPGQMNRHISLSRNRLRKLAGGNYKRTVESLKQKSLIQVLLSKNGYERYSSDGVYNPRTRKYETFCKRYILNDTIYLEVLSTLTQEGKEEKEGEGRETIKVVKRKVSVASFASFEDTTVISDSATAKVCKNYEKIEVPSHKEQEKMGINQVHHRVLEGIRAGIKNCRRASSGRIFHRLTNRDSKECREMIKVDGEYLTSTDFSAFHPHLLGSFIQDAVEKQRWLSFCKKDPYGQFAKMFGGTKIEYKERHFYIAISNKRKTKEAYQIVDFFEKHYPSIYSFLLGLWKKGETAQMTLQKMESSFMIPAFERANFWCLPIHDALLLKKSDRQAGIELLSNYVCERLGYDIPIK